EPGVFEPLRDTLLVHDRYMHLADLASYLEADRQLRALYANPDAWARKAILNVASSGKFSSDRTVSEYAAEIWHVAACPVPGSSPGWSRTPRNRRSSLRWAASPPRDRFSSTSRDLSASTTSASPTFPTPANASASAPVAIAARRSAARSPRSISRRSRRRSATTGARTETTDRCTSARERTACRRRPRGPLSESWPQTTWTPTPNSTAA